MNYHRTRVCLTVLLVSFAAGVVAALAGGPNYVTGPEAANPGQPYRWALNPIPYSTDQGNLGNQNNTAANSLVSAAFRVWQDVTTANISFLDAGPLAYQDVTSTNIYSFLNLIGNCSVSGQPPISIVYDVDGSIMTQLGYDKNSILGFAQALCMDDTAGIYTRSYSLLNGAFLDGQPRPTDVSLDEFKAVFIHEFGHLLGLDHSQINLNCLNESSCSTDDLAGLPIMFPILLDDATSNLKTDDIAALSALYPESDFATTTGRIQGRVMFSDGKTPAQGYNVIARKVGEPRRTAVSCVSGFLFTGGAGNPLVPLAGNGSRQDNYSFYGSRDPALIGFYDIPGLPSGTYTIEVEPINFSGLYPFVESSGLGPLGSEFSFQFSMPGTCNRQFLKFPSSPGDSCSDSTEIFVQAGETVNTNTDVILLGTPSRFDAWEDEP